MHIGILAHVDHGQMETEGLDPVDQPRQGIIGEGPGISGLQGVAQDLQIGAAKPAGRGGVAPTLA